MASRQMPWSEEAEVCVLGSMALDAGVADEILGTVQPDDFYHERHRIICEAFAAMRNRGETIDAVIAFDWLKAMGKLEAAGGPEFLARMCESVPTVANGLHYARIVAEKAALRRYISAQTAMLREAYDGPADVASFLAKAESGVQGLMRCGVGRTRTTRELGSAAFSALEYQMAHRGEAAGLATGLLDLDGLLHGMHPGQMIIVGARPAMGKTSLLLNICSRNAFAGVPCLIFSLEMSGDELMLRMVSTETGVAYERMLGGHITEEDFRAIYAATLRLIESPLHIDDSGGLSITTLRAIARRYRLTHNIGLIGIDYVGLMQGSETMRKNRQTNREQEMSEISRGIKSLAKELQIPIIVLAQLNRDPEKRANHRPQLSDLRDSGSLEADADAVLFVYRDEVYNEDTKDKGIAELILAKHRNGPIGTARVLFRAEETAFRNLAQGGGF